MGLSLTQTPAAVHPADSATATTMLLIITLIARVALLSAPYYIDGPNHVRAVANGTLLIQPPGYFLFAFTAHTISVLAHISAANAISAMNVAFSVLGVWMVRKITAELFPGLPGFLLTCCYAVSNVVWFAAEIHSTYASMTLFAPLLFYVLVLRARVRLAWIVWAVLTGFRPSDGVLLLPLMGYAAAKISWRDTIIGILLALPICACWYIPTAAHFGGSALSPLSAANRQLGQLPSGLLVHGFTPKGLNNLLHFLFGTWNAWNLLLPFVLLGLLEKDRIKWFCVAWIVPASLFFALYFVSDSLYLAFLASPGVVLAGFGLRRSLQPRGIAIAAGASVLIASVHMLLLRPTPAYNLPEAVIDSYSLEYTAWALKHRDAKRLADVVKSLH